MKTKTPTAKQLVRDYLTANPEAMPKETAETLSKQHRMTITPGYVSVIKSEMKKAKEAAPATNGTNGHATTPTITATELKTKIEAELGPVSEGYTRTVGVIPSKAPGESLGIAVEYRTVRTIADKIDELRSCAEEVGGIDEAVRVLRMLKPAKAATPTT